MKNVVIVAHKFLPQMDDELISYLNSKKYPNVLHIYHSFSDSKNRKSFYKYFKSGRLSEEGETSDFSYLPEPIIYLKELWFTFMWALKTKVVWNDFIGMDGLCVNFGLLLKSIGKVKKIIYWAVDFVPEKRFSSSLKNSIYHQININGYKKADEMWDLSPRMKEAREKYLGIKTSDYKSIKVVPYGMWTNRIKTLPYEKAEKKTLIFMGHLLEKQGVQLILGAIPQLIKKIPEIRLKIIGTGSYEQDLKSMVNQLKIGKYCSFLGKINDNQQMEIEIAKASIALAPYIKDLDTWTYFADPGKVKTYLACGVPVLLTNIPWNAADIDKQKCGIIIEESPADIVEKVEFLLKKENNDKYRQNAVKYSKQFDYQSIFSQLY